MFFVPFHQFSFGPSLPIVPVIDTRHVMHRSNQTGWGLLERQFHLNEFH
jgi:hypothetical protein